MTQANLAASLQWAGLRNNDIAQVKEAIAAYVAALPSSEAGFHRVPRFRFDD